VDGIGNVLGNNQLVLVVNRKLHIVAYVYLRTFAHAAAVRAGQRDLALPSSLQIFLQPFIANLTLSEVLNLLLQLLCRGLMNMSLFLVIGIQFIEVLLDFFINLN